LALDHQAIEARAHTAINIPGKIGGFAGRPWPALQPAPYNPRPETRSM